MNLRFEYLPYRRKFRVPLETAHGTWRFREGIVIRLEDGDGRFGFGEIAPVPWFGTETCKQALEWCREQPSMASPGRLAPSGYVCCQFALAVAHRQLRGRISQSIFPVAALIQSDASFKAAQTAGYSTFKAKIGVERIESEQGRIDTWTARLEPGQWLRLDANGGLSESAFRAWLEFLEGKPIEFLEQPMGPGLENRMLEMAEPYSTPIALDESATGSESLRQWAGWPGPLVIKPSLLGIPPASLPSGSVGSSVFETAFGYEAALQYLARQQQPNTALGFDTASLLESDGWSLHARGPRLQAGLVSADELQALWEEKR